MSWNWEELTSPDFAEAVQAAEGVCLVPIGVLERHSTHLPVGTDMMHSHEIATRAAALEPAVVFPPYFLGQVHESKNYPGCIALPYDLVLTLLDNLCQEISRNGLHKIVLLNGHGGNEFILPTFMTSMLEKPHDYTLYLLRLGQYFGPVTSSPEWKSMMVSDYDYHGGELETSIMLGARPELVRMDQLSEPGVAKGRLKPLSGVITPTWWYADYPEQYAGDATHATAEKGQWLLQRLAETVAGLVKDIKADVAAAQLEKEWFESLQH